MRWTQTLIPTLKETPAEAEIISHKLLLRAGLIRKLTGGLYTFLPLGLRALRKIEQIVREEMNRAGALELLMPALQSSRPGEEGVGVRADARGSHYDAGGGRDQFVPANAKKLLSDSDEVSG